VHEHFRDVCPVRLILRLREHDLHRADNLAASRFPLPASRLRDQYAFAARDAIGNFAPERRPLSREIGSMKLSDAPPSTQSINTSARASSYTAASFAWTRRTVTSSIIFFSPIR
jgi:hypothetical protein